MVILTGQQEGGLLHAEEKDIHTALEAQTFLRWRIMFNKTEVDILSFDGPSDFCVGYQSSLV